MQYRQTSGGHEGSGRQGGVQVTIFGDLRFRGTIYKNTVDFNSDVKTAAGPTGIMNSPDHIYFINNPGYLPYNFMTPGIFGLNTPYIPYFLPAIAPLNQPAPAAMVTAYGLPAATAMYGTFPATSGGIYLLTSMPGGGMFLSPVPTLNNVLFRPTSDLLGSGSFINPNVGSSERAVFESRIRLGFDIAANANTTGRILLEAGANNTNDNMPWGSNGSAAGNNNLVAGDAKANDMRVLEAWLQHKGAGLFGVPAYFKIGHMPIRVANGLFYSHTRFNDDAIVLGIEPVKGFNADFAYIKNAENNGGYEDDQDTYSLMLNYQIAKNSKIGADVSYVHSQNAGSRHVNNQNIGYSPWTIVTNPNATYGVDFNFWNFGINGKTDFGVTSLELGLDVAFQTGKVKDRGITAWWAANGVPESMTTPGGTSTYPTAPGFSYPTAYMGYGDVKLSGWAMTLDASYQFKPVKVMFGFAYGSGEDQNVAPADPRTPWIKAHMKNRTFQTSLESIPHYTFVYEYFTPNAANTANGGLQNTWYLKLGAAADITKDLYADMTVYYLRAVKNDPYTNPYGFAGKDMQLMAGTSTGYNFVNLVPVIDTMAGANQWAQTAAFRDAAGRPMANSNKNIGVEIDANVKYKIDKNLTYYIEGGYLFAGNFWRNVTGVQVDPATGIASWAKVDDAYAVRSGFQLTF